jgi:hypothetical protein
MGHIQPHDKLEFFKPKPADPRVVERWKARLEALSNSDGYLLQCTLFITNTKVFYVSEVRGAMKTILAGFLPRFVIKLEGAWQKSGFLLPHAHLLLPPVSEVRPFLTALKWSGVKVVRLEYRGQPLPDPFSLLPPDRGPTNLLEYAISITDLDLTALESLVDFRESTISALKNSPDLARYLAKTTYTGGLRPVIEHNLAPIREAEALAPPA